MYLVDRHHRVVVNFFTHVLNVKCAKHSRQANPTHLRHTPLYFIPNISLPKRHYPLSQISPSQKTVRAFSSDPLALQDDFARRHIGPSAKDSKNMLGVIGFDDMESMVKSTVPANILMDRPLAMDPAMTETEAVKHLKEVGS